MNNLPDNRVKRQKISRDFGLLYKYNIYIYNICIYFYPDQKFKVRYSCIISGVQKFNQKPEYFSSAGSIHPQGI